jgi:hypothetical protein
MGAEAQPGEAQEQEVDPGERIRDVAIDPAREQRAQDRGREHGEDEDRCGHRASMLRAA